MLRSGIQIFLALILNLGWAQGNNPFPKTLVDVEGRNCSLGKHQTQVFVFLSPECPACIYYVPKMNQIKADYNDFADFYAFFPSEDYSKKEVEKYCSSYSFTWKAYRDPKSSWVKALKATITPEVMVLHDSEIVYQGRIDNIFYSVGKRRNKVTQNDLEEVLKKLKSKEKFDAYHTQAIGCIIE